MGGPERPEQRQGLEVAFQPVVVSSSDIDGLVVAMSKGVDVAGRFVLEDPSVTAANAWWRRIVRIGAPRR